MRSLLLLVLLAAPLTAAAQPSTVIVEQNATTTRTMFEVSVQYADAGMPDLSEILALAQSQPHLSRIDLDGNARAAMLEIRFDFADADALSEWIDLPETRAMLDRIRAINPEGFRYELDLRRR